MKRFKAFALVLVMVLSLFACTACSGSSSSQASSAAPASAEEPAVSGGERVIYLVGYSRAVEGEETNWAKVIVAFEQENPGMKVDVRWQGAASESVQNLSSAQMAGETIDLFVTGPANINATLAGSGYLMDMTELMAPYMDRFEEPMLSGLYIGDKLWGIPYGDMSISMVIYNKTLFDELGLAAPETYDELLEIANTLKEHDASIMPMLHMGKMPMFWPMWFMETYAQTSGNNSLDNVYKFLGRERQFTGAEEQEAFEKVKAFYDDGILSAETFDTDVQGLVAAFAQGKTAMCYSMGFAYTALKNAVGDSMELGVFPFPQVVEGARTQHGGGTSDALVIPSFCNQDNLDITMKFIEYITRPENATIVFSARDLLAPTIKGVQAADIPIRDALDNEIIPDAMQFLDWTWPAEVNDAFMQAIPATLAGQMTCEQAAQSIQTALDTVYSQRDYDPEWWNSWTQEQWDAVTPSVIPPDYSV